MHNSLVIRPMRSEDAEDVLRIYQQGIETGNATFKTGAGNWAEFDAARLKTPRLVAQTDSGLAGWVVLSSAATSCIYGGVAELTIYVDRTYAGQGIGLCLIQEMSRASEAEGFWALHSLVFPENQASIRLHHRAGFRLVGIRERSAYMSYGPHKGWRDTVLMERRSDIIGI